MGLRHDFSLLCLLALAWVTLPVYLKMRLIMLHHRELYSKA